MFEVTCRDDNRDLFSFGFSHSSAESEPFPLQSTLRWAFSRAEDGGRKPTEESCCSFLSKKQWSGDCISELCTGKYRQLVRSTNAVARSNHSSTRHRPRLPPRKHRLLSSQYRLLKQLHCLPRRLRPFQRLLQVSGSIRSS